MSTANIEGFLERVKTDDALRSKVAEIDRSDDAATATALATISTEAGFSCSPEEFLELLRAKQELADEDLEPVAGGIDRP